MATTRLILIDDSETERKMFELYLHMMRTDRFSLHHCASIEQAQRDISASPDQFDVMLLDNAVPPYRDYRQTVPLLRDAGFAGPIILLSGHLNNPIFDEYRHHGVQLCTDKLRMSRRLEGLIDRALQMDVGPCRNRSSTSVRIGY